jgi:hypothetical protein
MRTLLIALALLQTIPALAAANASHDGCGTSDVSLVIVDAWTTQCVGVVAAQPPCFGQTRHVDVDALHLLVLSGWGCQTGALVDLTP